jgi:hypothetical protein
MTGSSQGQIGLTPDRRSCSPSPRLLLEFNQPVDAGEATVAIEHFQLIERAQMSGIGSNAGASSGMP